MKTSWLRLAAVVGLSIGALAIPIGASAGGGIDSGTSVYRSSGQVAQLYFDVPDPANPCLDTNGFVFGGNFKNTSPGAPSSADSVGGVFVYRSDNCAGTSSGVFYKGSLPAGALQIEKTLSSASLSTTVSGRDENGNDVPITIDLAWTATGPLSTEDSSFHYRQPGVNVVTRSSGDTRQAQANGTLTVGDDALAISSQGSLQSDRNFYVSVCYSSSGCK